MGSVVNTKGRSVVFNWKVEDFNLLLKSCEKDDEVLISLKYLNDKQAKILEAGCGLGRVVKYLHDRSYKSVYGVELNEEIVTFLNKSFPELNVIYGNIINLLYQQAFFDVVLSYGIIEHFPDGPNLPMRALFNALKPNGIAIVTVPSFTFLRKIKYFISKFDLRKSNFIRKFFGKRSLYRNGKNFSFYINPQFGGFFEYQFTPKQFESICKKAGFNIIESKPIAHFDGLFHDFGAPFITFKDWQFNISRYGKVLNWILSKVPFLHNHMHACVLTKLRE